MRSSWIRDWTCIPCIARQILNHWTTIEVPLSLFYGWRNRGPKSWDLNPGCLAPACAFSYSTILPLGSPSHCCIYLLSLTLPICFSYCGVINHPRLTSLKQLVTISWKLGSETQAGLNWAVVYAPLHVGWCHSLSRIKLTDTGKKNWEQRQGKYSIFSLCHIALFELVTLQM